MTPGRDSGPAEIPPMAQPDRLDTYRREVLRWNRRINLVSRRDAAGRLEALIRECSAALMALPAGLAELDEDISRQLAGHGPEYISRLFKVYYVDIGSGAGLPGIVWWMRLAHLLAPPNNQPGSGGECWLVEPQGKRAWFLEQTLRKLALPQISVLERRWGESCPELSEVAAQAEGRICWLLSLKALRLEEEEVLRGWQVATRLTVPARGDRLVIARFLPPAADELPEAGAGQRAVGSDWPRPGRRLQPYGPLDSPLGRLGLTIYGG